MNTESYEVRCCKGCPDCMGIGSREQIKALEARVQEAIAACERFETAPHNSVSGYGFSVEVRDILAGRYP